MQCYDFFLINLIKRTLIIFLLFELLIKTYYKKYYKIKNNIKELINNFMMKIIKFYIINKF
jgi:hypothetical protein